MIHKIVIEKNRRRPVLHEVCRAVLPDDVDWPKIQKLADDLADTLEANPDAVGLAAPQVGVPVRVIAVRTGKTQITVLVNPEVEVERGWRMIEEGCLSLPKRTFLVQRSQTVCVRALKASDGTSVKLTARGNALAQALQHEIDHLNGVLLTERGKERLPGVQKIIDPWAK